LWFEKLFFFDPFSPFLDWILIFPFFIAPPPLILGTSRLSPPFCFCAHGSPLALWGCSFSALPWNFLSPQNLLLVFPGFTPFTPPFFVSLIYRGFFPQPPVSFIVLSTRGPLIYFKPFFILQTFLASPLNPYLVFVSLLHMFGPPFPSFPRHPPFPSGFKIGFFFEFETHNS